MNNGETKPASSTIGSLTGSIADWIRAKTQKYRSPSGGMLLDDDPYPATYSLSSLQEQPVFHVDKESRREFALLDDLEDRGELKASASRPRPISESESGYAV